MVDKSLQLFWFAQFIVASSFFYSINRLHLRSFTVNVCSETGLNSSSIGIPRRKNAAYNRLLEKYRPIDPSATRAVVVKKINNLRTAYKKELDKWKGSQKSGAGTDEIRTPTLWYFHFLDFLYKQEIPRSSISNISDDDSEFSQQFQNKQSDDERDVSTPSSTPVRFRPTKKTNTLTDEVLRTVSDHFKRPKTEDRFDVFGKNIGLKLRELPKRQRILAEKIINETLFLAEMDALTMSHSVKSSAFENNTFVSQLCNQPTLSEYRPQTQTNLPSELPIPHIPAMQYQYQ
ncbi:hypothetical protein FQR65_LT02919 [Abscondita terminalis]|nr:hypothetical protein FQR65_LT02919 [Abscondita terminalis]